jgi:Zn-dependent peptidase ImmA (M78 family)/DNA-binding transcriptional regulator YiaG
VSDEEPQEKLEADATAASRLFDAQRLRVARHAEKLSGKALADRIAVSATAISQWEAGDTRPRPEAVTRLSAVLNYPPDYFVTSGRYVGNLSSDCSFFRSLRGSRQRDRDAAAAHAALIAELVIVLERYVRLSPVNLPLGLLDKDATLERIDHAAQTVRDTWGLGYEPIPDVLREIETHGPVVARLGLADNVDAFSWPAQERPIVILGVDKQNRIRSRFDAAHELGHLVMHRELAKAADPALEKPAHRFGSAFLIPTECLREEWPAGRIDWRKLMAIKQRWQISLAALLYRARQDGLITEKGYTSATRYITRAGWRQTEPGDGGPPERPRLLAAAMEALGRSGMTVGDLADEARLPLRLVELYLQPTGLQRVDVSF